MSYDDVRPLLSAILGAVFTSWMMRRWARFVPNSYGPKDADKLVNESRGLIRASKWAFLLAIGSCLVLYERGTFAQNDPWGVALLFGIGVVTPMLLLGIVGLTRGKERMVEAFVALSVSGKTPPLVTSGLFVLGVACLVGGVVNLIYK